MASGSHDESTGDVKIPYLIGEVGVNHGGSRVDALKLIQSLANAGWHAAKFQIYKADTLASKRSPVYFNDAGEPAVSQWEFFRRYDGLNRDDYEVLAAECKRCGIDFLATAFDVETLEWVAPLVPAFKVASADITNVPLLSAIARWGKPVYVSTGAATEQEIAAAMRILADVSVTLLHCVLAYPTPQRQANLGMIPWLKRRFNRPVGYSDHVEYDPYFLKTAYLLGATVIEKHVTLDKDQPGNDHYHAADRRDMRYLVEHFRHLIDTIGTGTKAVLPIEEPARQNARQSWHAAWAIPAGSILTQEDITLKRPATGLPPDQPPIGRRLLVALEADDPVTVGCVE